MNKEEDIELQENLLNGTDSFASSPNSQELSEYVTYKGETFLRKPLTDWRVSKNLKSQILFSFSFLFLVGLSDQAVGSLIPTLIELFNTTQFSISIIFILQFCGYSTAALSNNWIHLKFGRVGVLTFGISSLIFAYSFIGIFNLKLPLAIFIPLFYFIGLGIGLTDSCLNVYLSNLDDSNEIMGIFHGTYGLGSIFSPPIISFILKIFGKEKFYYGYLGLLIISIVELIGIRFTFKNETPIKYEYFNFIHHDSKEIEDDDDDEDQGLDNSVSFQGLIKDWLIIAFCVYLFLYIGAEISISSWILTYLLQVMNLEQLESSFIISWFWIGLSVGRIFLGFCTKYFKNEYRANLSYSITSFLTFSLLTILCFFISPSIHFLNFLVFLSGIFIGPLFPTANIALIKILPSKYHVLAVGIFTSLGGCGSAILPFLVGNLADLTGFRWLLWYIWVPIGGYSLVWLGIPKLKSRFVYDY
ncbi:hypothetical protein WICMUC_000326 [Wickerhamomyces mucosus]|uniref:Major facilitator superfamily (MFS) profile domain-containing protein n=1 Tax=Wickerhamomyces mucosus TaxID=1378264 RepID=A0A9P8PZG8_9ASCO|nr:hypothetical protein WICMUC_000326 [Wickerhamomyces mucosus]